MKHLLLVIGNDLKLHSNYLFSIDAAYLAHFKELNTRILLGENESELPFLLSEWLEKYDYISIYTTHYSLVARTLATLSKDTLILKDEILLPSRFVKALQNSVLLQVKRCKINILKVALNEPLPPLLAPIKTHFEHFCLLETDEESALILLKTIANSYEITLLSSPLLPKLTLIKAWGAKSGKLSEFLGATRRLFGAKFLHGDNPIRAIAQKLVQRGLKISFAESCTAGLCASELAHFNGVSAIFEGSVVTYSNRLKHEWLGISYSLLDTHGAYSEKCVYFMLKGVFKTAAPDFALAISGVAGDADDGAVKAGTVFIGAMYKDGAFLQETLQLRGERNFVRHQATLAAFTLLPRLKPALFE